VPANSKLRDVCGARALRLIELAAGLALMVKATRGQFACRGLSGH